MRQKDVLDSEKVILPIPYDLRSVNSYLIEEPSGLTIIDTGDFSDEAISLWKEIIGNRKVWRVIITHLHIDHFGLASWFKDFYGAEIWMSERSHEQLKKRKHLLEKGIFYDDNLSFLSDYGFKHNTKLPTNLSPNVSFQFSPDYLFTEQFFIEGDSYVLRPIWTPGHSFDHYCLYEENTGVLFLGDHLLENINPIVLPATDFQNPLASYLTSFDQILQLVVSEALPGHGDNIKNLVERVELLRNHYHNKCKQIIDSIPKSGATPKMITAKVYAHKPPELKNASFIQVITYLHYLVDKGYLKRQSTDNGYVFFKTDVVVQSNFI
ncbi:MBL fold metallo-hydrolase [Rummeliibacillus pycnus]|uniref:MBL fold metallo-hydrolase n=1 Tax=Rummeliibacillus pycnus TaxID=101070 RepID=UPI003D2D6057